MYVSTTYIHHVKSYGESHMHVDIYTYMFIYIYSSIRIRIRLYFKFWVPQKSKFLRKIRIMDQMFSSECQNLENRRCFLIKNEKFLCRGAGLNFVPWFCTCFESLGFLQQHATNFTNKDDALNALTHVHCRNSQRFREFH